MGRRVRKKHIFFNVNWRGNSSGKKYKHAIERYILLLKRQERDGENTRITKTMDKAKMRIKKFGISQQQITNALEHK